MLVNLDPLPYTLAFDIIKFCYEHNIDKEKSIELLEAWYARPCPKNLDWSIDIPEKYLNWIVMSQK